MLITLIQYLTNCLSKIMDHTSLMSIILYSHTIKNTAVTKENDEKLNTKYS